MNPSAVNIAVIDGKTITQSVELRTEKVGSPVRVKAVKGGHYLLAEGEKGVAPENVTIKRVGKDLHLSLEGSDLDQPQLIIEDFYGSDGQLVGMAEDGNYYDYISSDAEQDHEAAFLLDGNSSAQVLGATPLVGFANGLVAAAGVGFWPAVLGLGALAAAAVGIGKIIDNNNGGGGGGTPPPGGVIVPDQPVLGSVHDDVGDITGEIENGGSTDDTQPTFSGTGTPGNTIVVTDKGTVIGEVVVGEDGNWEFTPETPLGEGDHSVVIVEKNPGGGTSTPTDPFDFIVDTIAPGRSTIEQVLDDEGDLVGPIANNGFTDDSTPTLSGTAEAGARVDIFANGEKIGETTADSEGNWTYTTPELADATYIFTSVAVDLSGNAGLPSLPHTITIITTLPDRAVIDEVIDDVGPVTGTIGNGDSTDDTQPTFTGGGNPGDKVSVIVDGENIGETIVDEDGRWEFTPEEPLEEGRHEVVVVITNPAGGEGEPSDPWVIIVDTTAPDTPTIGSVYDDQGDDTGNLNPGDVTDDARPTISGTAEAGSTVIIYDNGVEIGRTPVNAEGEWTFTPENPLPNGPHQLTVEAVDEAGNVSDPSDPFDFSLLAGGAATAPSISTILDDVGDVTDDLMPGAVTDDTRPTIVGRGQAGDTVTVYSGTLVLGTAVVAADGTWQVTPEFDLAEGLHNITAVATNAVGNLSPSTGIYPITIDTTAPDAAGDLRLVDDVGPITDDIEGGDTTDDNTPTFVGTAEPGATVIIYDGAEEIGRVPVSPEGTWTFTPAPPLSEGEHSLSTVVVDEAGNRSPATTPIDFTVDTSAVEISISHVSDNVGPITDDLASGSVTDDTTPTLHGRGTPGGTVTVYIDGVASGTTTVNAAGNWEYTVAPAMAEGDYVFTATVTTEATGESAPTGEFRLEIDTTAPGVPGEDGELPTPVIGSIHDDVGEYQGELGPDAHTDDTTPTLRGSGLEQGDKVDVYNNGELLGRAEVQADGTWSFTPNPPLNPGEVVFTIIAEDAAGNRSGESAPWTITIDTTAPDAPTIDSVYDDQGDDTRNLDPGDVTDDASPTISGSAEPGSTVVIYDNDVEIGRADVNAAGQWVFEPTTPLSNGAHELTVKAVDKAGNLSNPSDPFDFTLLAGGAATAPSISTILDDVGDVTDDLMPGAVTDDTRPTIVGRGQAGDTVTVYSGTLVLGTAVVAADGTWQVTPEFDLAEGLHNITAVATNAVGNLSPSTGIYPITIDTTAPDAAGDLRLVDDVGPITDDIEGGDTTDDNTPTFVGTAEPGATVIIYDGAEEIGRVPVSPEGTWTFTPAPPLSEGEHSLSTVVVDEAGNRSPATTPIDFTVDTSAVEISISHVSDNVGPITDDLASGSVTDDTTPTLHGRGTPGGTVTVYIDGVASGTTTVNAAGNWEYTVAPAMAEGDYVFTATVTTEATGESAPTGEFRLEIDTTAPGVPGEDGELPTPVIGSIHDDVGEYQGELGPDAHTDDTTPTLRGSGLEQGDKVDVYNNGELLGRAEVQADGTWSFTPNPPLNPGEVVFTIIAEDAAGNRSGESAPWTITIDTTAPDAPTIDSVYDDQGDDTRNLEPGDVTDDASPTISGSAEPGSTVVIYDNDVEIGRADVNAAGQWVFEPTTPLSNGAHELTVKAVDKAGNLSNPSDPFDFTLLAGGAATAPSISTILDDVGDVTDDLMPGAVTDDTRPTIVGRGQAGDTVTVYSGTLVLGTAVVAADGTWQVTPEFDLAEGLHNITAVATNAVGNLSPSTGIYPITIDTTAPDAAGDLRLVDDVGPITDDIEDGDTTDDNTPTFVGTAEPGATVIIYDGAEEIGRVPVSPEGTWTFTPAPPLSEGEHSLSTVVVDEAGNRSPATTPIDFTVDTSAVEISISHVSDNVGPITDNLASGGVTDDTTPTVHGRGTPGGTVTVYIDGVASGTTTVNAAGDWQYTVAPAMTEGDYVFTATVTTEATGESAPTGEFRLEIDTTAPGVPGEDGELPTPVIGSIHDDVGEYQGELGPDAHTDDTTPTLRGSGLEQGDKVDVYNNGELLGRAEVQADGTWSFTPNPPLNPGEVVFTIIAEDAAGNRSGESAPWTITIDTTAPEASAVVTSMGKDSGVDRTDFVTNDGTAGRLIHGTLTALLAEGEKVQVSTDGGLSWLDALLHVGGSWSFVDNSAHTGSWEIQTRVSNKAGVTGALTVQDVTLDVQPPLPPAISLAPTGESVQVVLSDTGAVAEDVVTIIYDGRSFEYALSAADIAAGQVVLAIIPAVSTNQAVMVAITDNVGNTSDYRSVGLKSNNFGSHPQGPVGDVWTVDGLTLTRLGGGTLSNRISGGTGVGYWDLPGGTQTITSIDMAASHSVSFVVGSTGSTTVRYFSASGAEIHSEVVSRTNTTSYTSWNDPITKVIVEYTWGGGGASGWHVFWGISQVLAPTAAIPSDGDFILDGSEGVYGTSGDDVFSIDDVTHLADMTAVSGGEGVDTIRLTGSGQLLDLTSLVDKIHSVEIVDLTGTGNNTLNLSVKDVLEHGETNLFHNSGKVQMMVKGNAGDVVNLDDMLGDTDPGDWASQGQVTVAGVSYDVYQHSGLDAELLVQQGVTTNLV